MGVLGASLDDLQLVDAWPLGADDVVETPGEGQIPLADLIEAIEQVSSP